MAEHHHAQRYKQRARDQRLEVFKRAVVCHGIRVDGTVAGTVLMRLGRGTRRARYRNRHRRSRG